MIKTYSETVLQGVIITDVETLAAAQIKIGVERHD